MSFPLPKLKKKPKVENNYSAEDLPESYYQEVIDTFMGEKIYKVNGFNNNTVLLERIRSGMCPSCGRQHGDSTGKGDNARFIISANKNLIFSCWRGSWCFVEADLCLNEKYEDESSEEIISLVDQLRNNFEDMDSILY